MTDHILSGYVSKISLILFKFIFLTPRELTDHQQILDNIFQQKTVYKYYSMYICTYVCIYLYIQSMISTHYTISTSPNFDTCNFWAAIEIT